MKVSPQKILSEVKTSRAGSKSLAERRLRRTGPGVAGEGAGSVPWPGSCSSSHAVSLGAAAGGGLGGGGRRKVREAPEQLSQAHPRGSF